MNDKTLCYGNDCPLREDCNRWRLNNNTDVAHWTFGHTPYDITREVCNYYIKKEDEKH
jgi:hypothetical protein